LYRRQIQQRGAKRFFQTWPTQSICDTTKPKQSGNEQCLMPGCENADTRSRRHLTQIASAADESSAASAGLTKLAEQPRRLINQSMV